MRGDYRITELASEDIPALAVLYRQFWGEDSDAVRMKVQFEKLRARGTHIFLCAKNKNELCGSVMGIVCEELYGDCRPFLVIENMVVDEKCRRQGIGLALLN
jgi:GNAT superfamily N-acetyltransferase